MWMLAIMEIEFHRERTSDLEFFLRRSVAFQGLKVENPVGVRAQNPVWCSELKAQAKRFIEDADFITPLAQSMVEQNSRMECPLYYHFRDCLVAYLDLLAPQYTEKYLVFVALELNWGQEVIAFKDCLHTELRAIFYSNPEYDTNDKLFWRHYLWNAEKMFVKITEALYELRPEANADAVMDMDAMFPKGPIYYINQTQILNERRRQFGTVEGAIL